MQDLLDKIDIEMDYMELNARQFKMGLIKLDPYLELHKHHVANIREYLGQIDCYDEPHDRGGGILH